MADHLQEEEQLEAISQWWQENRRSIIALVVLTLGGTIAWSQYEEYTSEKAVAAANTYDGLLQERESGESAEELAYERPMTARFSRSLPRYRWLQRLWKLVIWYWLVLSLSQSWHL